LAHGHVVRTLLTSRSSRRRGLSLSVAGSAAVVLIGGVIYDFWIFW
jgi:hypothetical protein